MFPVLFPMLWLYSDSTTGRCSAGSFAIWRHSFSRAYIGQMTSVTPVREPPPS